MIIIIVCRWCINDRFNDVCVALVSLQCVQVLLRCQYVVSSSTTRVARGNGRERHSARRQDHGKFSFCVRRLRCARVTRHVMDRVVALSSPLANAWLIGCLLSYLLLVHRRLATVMLWLCRNLDSLAIQNGTKSLMRRRCIQMRTRLYRTDLDLI